MTRICFSTLSIVLIAFSQVISAKAIPEGGGSYKAPAPKPAAPAPRVSTPAPRPSTPVARAEGGGGYVPPKTATPATPTPRPSTPVARAEGGGGYVPPKSTTPTPAVTPAPTPSRPVARAEGGGGYVPPKTTTQTPAVTPAPTPSRPVARAEGGGAYVPPAPAVPKLTPAQEKTKFEIERYAKNNGYTPEQTAALVYRSMTPEKQRNADAAAAAAAREKLTGMTAAQEKTKAQIEKYAANNGYTEQQTKDLVYRSMTTAKQREADALKAKEQAAARQAVYDKYSNDNFNDSWKGPLPSQANVDALKAKYAPPKNPLLGMTQQEIRAYAKDNNLTTAQLTTLMNEVKKNAPVVVTTVGLTDANGSGFAGSVCALTDPKCKNSGSIQAYGNNGNTKTVCEKPGRVPGSCDKYTTVPVVGGLNDFVTDKKTMDIYQKFMDQAKVDPKTGKVVLPDKVCSGSVVLGACMGKWIGVNDDIKQTGLNPFTSKDNQTYDSVQDIMNQAVSMACGNGKPCNGNNQTANVAGHSAGGVTGTIAAVALNNANFNVTNMSGYEMVVNNGQYNILQDMGVNLTNYSATTTVTSRPPNSPKPVKVTVESTAGWAIQFGEGVIDGLLSGQKADRPDYYTSYVPRTDFKGSTDVTGGHATENNAVTNIIKESLQTPPQPSQTPTNYSGSNAFSGVSAGAGTTPSPVVTPIRAPKAPTVPTIKVVTTATPVPMGEDYIPPSTPTP